MAIDETWSAKVSVETKDELGQLIKGSGISSKEFLEQLIINHKMVQLQGSEAQRSEDIQQLTYHLNKIKASYVTIVEKGIDLADMYTEKLELESVSHKTIVDQQQQIFLKCQLEKDSAISKKVVQEQALIEITARNLEFAEINSSQRITMQMEKLTSLEERLGSVDELEEEINRVVTDNDQQRDQLEALTRTNLDILHQVELAKAAHETRERELVKAAEQQAQFHSLELDNAVLQAEKSCQDKFLAKNESLAAQIETLKAANQALLDRVHEFEFIARPAIGRQKDQNQQVAPSDTSKGVE